MKLFLIILQCINYYNYNVTYITIYNILKMYYICVCGEISMRGTNLMYDQETSVIHHSPVLRPETSVNFFLKK